MPCRGKPEMTATNLLSLLESAKNPEEIEVFVRFDEDDKETIKFFSNMEFLRDYDIHICTGVRHGYEHMERYYN